MFIIKIVPECLTADAELGEQQRYADHLQISPPHSFILTENC